MKPSTVISTAPPRADLKPHLKHKMLIICLIITVCCCATTQAKLIQIVDQWQEQQSEMSAAAAASSSLLPDYVIDDDEQTLSFVAGQEATELQQDSSESLRNRRDLYAPSVYSAQSNQLSSLQVSSPQESELPATEPQVVVSSSQKIGPQFTREPPSYIHYLNSSDLVIACAASGNPTPSITWWHKSGGQLKMGSLLDKLYVRYDNALVISAFKAHQFEPEIHATTYKCQASNSMGTIISRDVVINAVLDQDYEATVADQFVSADNDALFKCQLAPQLRDIFQVTGWLEDNQQLVGGVGGVGGVGQVTSSGKQLTTTTTTLINKRRAQMLPDGQLFLSRVQLRDANKSYKCQIKNLLSGRTSLSSIGGRLFVTDANESGASARIVEGPRGVTFARQETPLELVCVAQGSPRPTIRWFKWRGQAQVNQQLVEHEGERDERDGQWIELTSQQQQQANETLRSYLLSSENNLLLIKSPAWPADQRARFKCLANNSHGAHQLETELRVDLLAGSSKKSRSQLELKPRVEFVRGADASTTRQRVVFNCSVRTSSQPLVALEWLRNGRQLFAIQLAELSSMGELSNKSATQPAPPLFEPSTELQVIEQPWTNFIDKTEANSEQQQQLQLSSLDATMQPIVFGATLAKLAASQNTIKTRVWQTLQTTATTDELLLLYQLHLDDPLQRQDRGSYQCRARWSNGLVQQSTSQLLLRDTPPKFIDTFASSSLINFANGNTQLIDKQQQSISLKCVAAGSPLPEISWTLSGFPVPESSRFRVGDYVTRDGLIVSFVNISQVQPEDGGLYECTATNDVGQLRHAGWLNVTGPPEVRPIPPVAAIAGSTLTLMCPVGGWPIERISWFKNTTKLPTNHRQKVSPNGTLTVSELNELLDAGRYSCEAKWRDLYAVNHVQVTIKIPPLVEPFSFAKSLHRGQRYNIMCTVTRGDLPVTIRWFKDGQLIGGGVGGAGSGQLLESVEQPPLRQHPASGGDSLSLPEATPPEVGLAIKQLDPYSSTLTFASLQSYHRGLYSCEATNEVGRANQSSALVIHVPPEWQIEPADLSVTLGRTAVIDCQADGFPAARIEWRLAQAQSLDGQFREPPSEFKPIISSLYMRVFENGSLIIYNTQRTDAGYYLCQASNGIGPGISRVIKLTVHVAAHFKTKIRTELVRRGQPARLRCESLGDPPLEINWLKDKLPLYYAGTGSTGTGGNQVIANQQQQLDLEPRYSLTRTPLMDGLASELTIQEADRSDSALFTCIAQNLFGQDETNIQLLVQSAPDAPHDIRLLEVDARSVKISWTLGHSGNSPLIKQLLMYTPTNGSSRQLPAPPTPQQQFINLTIPGNESTCVIQNLTPLTEYHFHLLAFNSLGSSQLAPPNEPAKFRTEDEAPVLPATQVKARAVSSHSLKVRWRAPEQRGAHGTISGFYVGYRLHRPGSSGSLPVPGGSAGANSQTGGGGEHSRWPATVYKTISFSGVDVANVTSEQEQECQLDGLRRGQKYVITVQPFNGRGAGPMSEPIVAETWRIDVPEAPQLRVLARTTNSVHLAWRLAASASHNNESQVRSHKSSRSRQLHARQLATAAAGGGGGGDQLEAQLAADELTAEEAQASEPILGFLLARRQLTGDSSSKQPADQQQPTVETRLPSEHLSQLVNQLACGTRYQFTVAAINSVGVSEPSDPLIVKTEGSTPVAPDRSSLLSLNASSVVINLGAWHNGACTMRSFDILFKPSRARKWTTLTNYQIAQPATGSEHDDEPRALTNSSASSMSVAQRSAGSRPASYQQQQQQQQQYENGTVVLDDLALAVNYDLKIVATNEAGSTEALYTFNTNGQTISSLNLDQNWPQSTGTTNNEFQFNDVHLNELFSTSGFQATLATLLPLLLLLLLIGLSISTACILLARRRHASPSSCSLSISSRSNQSSSNYCTTATTTTTTAGTTATNGLATNDNNNYKNTTTTFLNSSTQGKQLDGFHSPALMNGQTIRLGEMYDEQQQHYAYLTAARRQQANNRSQSPTQTTVGQASSDLTSVLNGSGGSEVEMCLGASALNLGGNPTGGLQSMTLNHRRRLEPHVETSPPPAAQSSYYVEQQQAKLAQHLAQLGKSSTLPSNCHQQLSMHKILDQQQQQMIDSYVTANMIQQQQQQQQHLEANDQEAAAAAAVATYASLQAALQQASSSQQYNNEQQVNSLLLDQQTLRQQVYATVKRGCPRPPDQQLQQRTQLCDYTTIYQCNPDHVHHQSEQQQQQQLLSCCAANGVDHSHGGTLGGPVPFSCYHGPHHQECNQTTQGQQQPSDYQQLRPLNQ